MFLVAFECLHFHAKKVKSAELLKEINESQVKLDSVLLFIQWMSFCMISSIYTIHAIVSNNVTQFHLLIANETFRKSSQMFQW